MHQFSNIPNRYPGADVQYFLGTSTAAGGDWDTWQKPPGKTMVNILLVGKGGNGGTGVIGAAGGGGGGGGSGGQTRLTMPLALLPEVLYLSLAGHSATTTLSSFITIQPRLAAGPGSPVANDVLATAFGGGNGGNAATTTGGTAGAAAGAVAASGMPLGWHYAVALAGQAGTAGGNGTTTGTVGGALTLPTTGLLVTGGTGGGAAPTTVGVGTAGGIITGAGAFPTGTAVTGGTAATVPPLFGTGGYRPVRGLIYGYGGQGGGGTYTAATGAGLVQSHGGNGAPGCGGGGMGGAYTGSTAGVIGNGGVAFAIITCW